MQSSEDPPFTLNTDSAGVIHVITPLPVTVPIGTGTISVTAAVSATWNFAWQQGVTFVVIVEYDDSNSQPISVTNFAAAMEVAKISSPDAPATILNLNDVNGSIVVGGGNGQFTITTTATQTATLAVGTYAYDLIINTTGNVNIRLMSGTIRVYP